MQHTVFSETLRIQNALIVQKLENETLRQILFVRSCKPILQEFTSILMRGDLNNLKYSIFNDIMHLLELIMNFLFNVSETKAIFYEDYREDPVPFRQKILKDCRMIEILTDLIFLCGQLLGNRDLTPSNLFWIDRVSSILP